MKKSIVMLAILALSISGLYANGRGEMTTIEGTLAVRDSVPVVETAEGMWLLPPGPFYRVAWENKISVGDTLSIQGFANRDVRLDGDSFVGRVMPVTVSVNGKDLDIRPTSGNGLRCFASDENGFRRGSSERGTRGMRGEQESRRGYGDGTGSGRRSRR